MAKVNFNEAEAMQQSLYTNKVNFFNLKNDKEEAIVRFMHDDLDSFEIYTVHNIKVDGKFRKATCIRDPRDSVDACPLCAAKAPVEQRFFIRMIQYVPGADGSVTPQAVVWERSFSYATKLKSYLDNYGPLSNIVCKIVRHGQAGSVQTTYEIIPNLNPTIYSEQVYAKDASLFDDYSVLGAIVMNKNYNELSTFLATGSFPAATSENTPESSAPAYSNTPVNNYATPATGPATGYSNPAVNYQPSTVTPAYTPTDVASATPAPARMPWETGPRAGLADNAMARPERKY